MRMSLNVYQLPRQEAGEGYLRPALKIIYERLGVPSEKYQNFGEFYCIVS